MTLCQSFGTPLVTYKNPFEFGKYTGFVTNNTQEINYTVLDKQTDNFETPVMYNNLSLPVTLTFINKNIKTNYQINKSGASVTYDGRLLKLANVDITKLYSKLSFKITIKTIDGQEYFTKLYIDIPYKTEEKNIYDGSLLKTIKTNGTAKFYNY